jgi:hypothetical protein
VTLLVTVWLVAPASTHQADVALLLGQARQAMGGDAVLKAISNVTMNGDGC